MGSDKLYAAGSGLEGGPHTDVVRKRVLAAQAAAGNGQSVGPLVPGVDLAQAMVAPVPVQQAYPGRRCQLCDLGPEQQLATLTRPSSTGGGVDFYCAWHAPDDCVSHVRIPVQHAS